MDIIKYPDPVLMKKAEPVHNIDENIQELINNMSMLMYNASGIGLAANQVGVAMRVIIFDIDYKSKGESLVTLINPVIKSAEETISLDEGCLSVPDFQGHVTRKKHLLVEGVDRHGNPVKIEAEDLQAVCIQHEIDHLNGTLIIDHVSHLKRSLYKRKIMKLMKKTRQ